MKTLILLIAVMMITSFATAKRSGQGSRKGSGRRDFDSKQCDGSGEEQQERVRDRYKEHKGDCDGSGNGEVQERKCHKKHKGYGDGSRNRKPTQEQIEKRIRRMSKGNEEEYNRLIKLHKDDPEAFRKEMRSRRSERSKNRDSRKRDSKNRDSKNRRGE